MTDPIILAHRGLTVEAPENTLAAFRKAFERGFGIETDLRPSAEGEIVLIHDATLERTTSGQGAVNEHTLAQLQALDAGSGYDPQFHDERIPTLAQLLDLAASVDDPSLMLGLEIKATEPLMLERLCAAIAERSLFDRVLSFGRAFSDAAFRRRLKAIEPRFPTSTRAEQPDEWAAAVAGDNADWIYVRFVPTSQQVAEAHAKGKRVLASAAPVMNNNPQNWLAARQAGVDVLLTDFPLECRSLYRVGNSHPDA